MTELVHKKYPLTISEYLLGIKKELIRKSNWKKIELTRDWAKLAPNQPGIYALKENEEIIYVGETGSLRGRMLDLLDSRNHTARRTIGKKLFAAHPQFELATNKKKVPGLYRGFGLNAHISSNVSIAYTVVLLGRKEAEEFIAAEIPLEFRLNIRGKRK